MLVTRSSDLGRKRENVPVKVKGGRGKQGTQRVRVSVGHSAGVQAEQKLRSSICRCSFVLLYCSLYLEICIWHPEWGRAAQGRSATGTLEVRAGGIIPAGGRESW